jgi:hypothetical protein
MPEGGWGNGTAKRPSRTQLPASCIDRLPARGNAQPNWGEVAMDFLLLLGAWLAMAIGAAVIADSKGRSAFAYFVLGFFFPLIGLLIAIGVAPI